MMILVQVLRTSGCVYCSLDDVKLKENRMGVVLILSLEFGHLRDTSLKPLFCCIIQELYKTSIILVHDDQGCTLTTYCVYINIREEREREIAIRILLVNLLLNFTTTCTTDTATLYASSQC